MYSCECTYLNTEERADDVNGGLLLGWRFRSVLWEFDYATSNALQFTHILATLSDDASNLFIFQ